ncbi:hypothetical protein [Kitasatospora sp. NBC_01302]|uniref:hypothetical protein n=1 Tax=Kitasatospora sp. NBC_01302 TaxID=2903575 RepID=UPI002E0DF78D|nr:hypothetical protein OG294_13890 [Kitasatospora sp. NBC_01302]
MFDADDDLPIDIPRCSCCPRELHGADYGRLACAICERRIFEHLNVVGQLWVKLPDSAHRPVGDRAIGRSTSVHAGIPGNAQVITLTGPGDDTPLGKLIEVEDDWRRAAGYRLIKNYGRPVVAMPRVLKFLRDHLWWACAAHKNPRYLDGEPLLPDVARLNEDLGPMVSALKRAVNADPPPRLIASRCVAPYVAGFDCPGLVRVGVDLEPRRCPLCGTLWEREAFIRAGQADQIGAAA